MKNKRSKKKKKKKKRAPSNPVNRVDLPNSMVEFSRNGANEIDQDRQNLLGFFNRGLFLVQVKRKRQVETPI